jgi:SAM-dependent methyltransferase
MRPMTPLCLLAAKYQTDKGGRHLMYNGGPCEGTHEYTPVYYDLLHGKDVRSVLEIGINSGASLRMWEEYFPRAKIIGLDIDPNCMVNEGRIQSFVADQRDWLSLMQALTLAGIHGYDLIVDDGLHECAAQMRAMRALLPYLRDGGIYIVEEPDDPDLLDLALPDGYTRSVYQTRGIGRSDKVEPIYVVKRYQDV